MEPPVWLNARCQADREEATGVLVLGVELGGVPVRVGGVQCPSLGAGSREVATFGGGECRCVRRNGFVGAGIAKLLGSHAKRSYQTLVLKS